MKLGVANGRDITDVDLADTLPSEYAPPYSDIVSLLMMNSPESDRIADSWLAVQGRE